MHILILSKRNAEAQARLLRAAEALATHYDLDPELVAALKPNTKDIKVRELLQREGAAALVEVLALKVGALEEPAPEEEVDVTAETDEGAVPEDADFVEGDIPNPALINEDLPPPVLEEGIQGAPVTDADGAAPHTGDEFVTVPIDEETESEPAPKATTKKKSTSKSSRKK